MDELDPLAGRHILIVEDEYFLAFDLLKKLKATGALVIGPAASLDKAWQLVADAPQLHGALLDMNLQGTMVYPLADELLQRKIPFLFTTGYDQLLIPPEFRDVPRLNKPYQVAEVLDELRKIVD